MKNIKLKLLAGLVAMSTVGMAQAATATATSQVTTSVTSTCTIAVGNIAFPSSAQVVGTSTISATLTPTCTKGTAYSVAINGGLNSGAGTVRNMKHSTNAAELLVYTLTQNDGTTAIAKDGVAVAATGDGFGGANQAITIKGHLNTYQRVIVGAYSDTLTATITY